MTTPAPASRLHEHLKRLNDLLRPLDDLEFRRIVKDAKALIDDPEQAHNAYLALGLAYLEKDNSKDISIGYFREAAKIAGSNTDAKYNLASLLFERNVGTDFEETTSIIQDLLSQPDGRRPHILRLHFEMLMRRRQLQDATEVFVEAAQKCAFDEPDMYLRLVAPATRLGMMLEAVELLARWALAVFPLLSDLADKPAREIVLAIPQSELELLRAQGVLFGMFYVDQFHPSTPASPRLGPRPGQQHGTGHAAPMAPVPTEAPASLSLRDRVAEAVRRHAMGVPGLVEAYVSQDGEHIALVGDPWTGELSERAGEILDAIQADVAPDFEPYLEGGLTTTEANEVVYRNRLRVVLTP